MLRDNSISGNIKNLYNLKRLLHYKDKTDALCQKILLKGEKYLNWGTTVGNYQGWPPIPTELTKEVLSLFFHECYPLAIQLYAEGEEEIKNSFPAVYRLYESNKQVKAKQPNQKRSVKGNGSPDVPGTPYVHTALTITDHDILVVWMLRFAALYSEWRGHYQLAIELYYCSSTIAVEQQENAARFKGAKNILYDILDIAPYCDTTDFAAYRQEYARLIALIEKSGQALSLRELIYRDIAHLYVQMYQAENASIFFQLAISEALKNQNFDRATQLGVYLTKLVVESNLRSPASWICLKHTSLYLKEHSKRKNNPILRWNIALIENGIYIFHRYLKHPNIPLDSIREDMEYAWTLLLTTVDKMNAQKSLDTSSMESISVIIDEFDLQWRYCKERHDKLEGFKRKSQLMRQQGQSFQEYLQEEAHRNDIDHILETRKTDLHAILAKNLQTSRLAPQCWDVHTVTVTPTLLSIAKEEEGDALYALRLSNPSTALSALKKKTSRHVRTNSL